MAMVGFGCFGGRLSVQELLFLFFFCSIGGTLGVECFHFFNLAGRQVWKVTDKVGKLPGAFFAVFCAAPGRHSTETDAVFDDVEQFAIRHPLGALFPHVWSMRIHLTSHFRFAAAVVGMTQGAVVRPMCSPLCK